MTLYILSEIIYSMSFCFTWRVLSRISSVCLLGRNSFIHWHSLCVFAQVPSSMNFTLNIMTANVNGIEYDFVFTTFKIIWLHDIWNRHFPSAVFLGSFLWFSQSRYISLSVLSLTFLPPSWTCHFLTFSSFLPFFPPLPFYPPFSPTPNFFRRSCLLPLFKNDPR